MNSCLITGSLGLVGYAACKRLLKDGWKVTGVDNDGRAEFFGPEASTRKLGEQLALHPKYHHVNADITNAALIRGLFRPNDNFDLILHTAAQPSHDWSAQNIDRDFQVNAVGTLNLLQAWRGSAANLKPTAPFVHISTSKIYGANPNTIQYVELPTRYEFPTGHPLWNGIPEGFSTDQTIHSLFGVSKLTGDLLAQEFGLNFGLPVGIFRPGCLTGGHHRGAELHGFLQYLMACTKHGKPYRVYGYKAKQVRDNLHADDLVEAFLLYANKPTPGAVYNIGGRGLDCSMMEAIRACEFRCDKELQVEYIDQPRVGDHVVWISDARKLQRELGWRPKRTLDSIFNELAEFA